MNAIHLQLSSEYVALCQAMLVLIASASLPTLFHSDVHPAVVYLGLYLAAIASGGVKPCISAFGADQFDVNDPVELVKKGSFFNWYFFLTTTSSLLSGTVIVWLQDNVGWAVSYVIPTVLMLICFPAFLAGSRVYRFRKMGVSPLTSILQVVVAAVRKWHVKLPDDSSLLYEQASSPSTTEHKNKHTNQFR
jgi:peptide/histidine transporter 3/4